VQPYLESLVASDEPAVRSRALRLAAGTAVSSLVGQIRSCPRVATLLASVPSGGSAYQKWRGAHWVLVNLAEIGYPQGDAALAPLRDRVLDAWLAPEYRTTFACTSAAGAYRGDGVPVIRGRARRCASQQGNALYATLTLGLADGRLHEIVRLLLSWQWPDGGWNCDKNPDADTSSFHETITPLRGLAAYTRWSGADPALREQAARAVLRASEVFLTRGLYRRRADGAVMNPAFLQLAYPRYWHYDLLFGLVVLRECGLLGDPRCGGALGELELQRRPDGGWPAGRRHYRAASGGAQGGTGTSGVDWGPCGRTRSNPWLTLDALEVLGAAGRV
jgi:hypothetical protein